MPLWIYSIRQKSTGYCYVGSSVKLKKRWIQHKSDLRAGRHYAKHLQHTWNKHGEADFEFLILEESDDCSDQARIQRETHWINQLDSRFNQAPVGGSMLGYKFDRDLVERIAEKQRLLKRSDKFKKAVSDFHRGRKKSPETIERMRLAQKARFANNPHHMKGRTRVFSEETKRKMSESAKLKYARLAKSIEVE